MKTAYFLPAVAGALLSLALAAGEVAAQAYPAKPIRLVVPFPPGGFADVYGRVLAAHLGNAFGQSVVVENRSGAGGNIGADVVAKSAPDGYTLVMGTVGTHAINVSLYSKMPYDAVRDFAPVAFVAEAESLLVAHPSVPANNIAELIALARSKPLTYGSAGAGRAWQARGCVSCRCRWSSSWPSARPR